MSNFFSKHLNFAEQRQTVWLFTRETKTTKEYLVDMFLSKQDLSSYIASHFSLEKNNDDDLYLDLFMFDRHEFSDGEIWRVMPYQIHDYQKEREILDQC